MLPNWDQIKKMHVVVIDDEPANVALMERILEWGEFEHVSGFCAPLPALASFHKSPPDIILLDLQMPRIDGYQVISQFRTEAAYDEYVPILVLTADATAETRNRVLSMGANDFLTKPVDATEIVHKVRNSLERVLLHRQIRERNEELERIVRVRSSEIEAARLEVLERLAIAAEFRDDDTGEHARRVGRTAAEIAKLINSPDANPDVMRVAAPLHDIGKIGIPDSVLLKPGKLTPEEFDVMKTHTTIGAKILGGSGISELSVAAAIALTHHERWNGQGYPLGLSGERIPLVGRIVAVADVFDALTHERPYKRAWTRTEAHDYIVEKAGTEFDPDIVQTFRIVSRTAAFAQAA